MSFFTAPLEPCRIRNKLFSKDIPVATTAGDVFADFQDEMKWLDVACGAGQTLEAVAGALPKLASQVTYVGTEIDDRYIAACQATADRCGWKRATFQHVSLNTLFTQMHAHTYHLVSLINVLHELPVEAAVSVIIDMLRLCDPNGIVLLFDMSDLPENEFDNEFGVVTWDKPEMDHVFTHLNDKLSQDHNRSIYSLLDLRNLSVPCFCGKVYMKWVDKKVLDDETNREGLKTSLRAVFTQIMNRKEVCTRERIEHSMIQMRDILDGDKQRSQIACEANRSIKKHWAVQRMIRSLSE